MAENDDELKDIFQQKNLENAFPLDEQNWEKMAAVIKNERKGRRKILIYFSLLLLLLGLGSIWFFVEHSQSENPTHTLALTPQQLRGTTTRSVKKEAKPLKQGVIKREAQVPEKVDASNVKSQQPEPLQEIVKPEKKTHLVKKIPTHLAEKQTASLVSNVPFSSKQESVEGLTNLLPTSQPEKKESLPPNKETSETANTGEKIDSVIPQTTAHVKTELSNNKKETNNITTDENLPQNDKLSSDSVLAFNHRPAVSVTNDLAKETTTVLAEKRDSSTNNLSPPKDSIPFKTISTYRIFIEAGTNYLLGWKTNNKTEANGFNPLIGLQYYHNLSKKTELSFGLHYTSINHLSSTSHTSSTSQIKFGEESDVTVISALNMHYMLLPLKLSYGLSKHDYVFIGYTMAYLLDVESKVEKYSTRLNYSSDPVVSKSMGYTKGFNPFDGQLTVCYRRRLYKEWWYIKGEFYYGLRDIKNNVVYATNEFERAYGFRFSLDINLWKK
jgi:hypothetical protein